MAELVTKDDLATGLENLGLRLSVRCGGMLAAGLSLMTAILGAMMRFHLIVTVRMQTR